MKATRTAIFRAADLGKTKIVIHCKKGRKAFTLEEVIVALDKRRKI